MALTAIVTKAFPGKDTVGMHLKLTDDDRADLGDGEQTIIDKDFMESFSGDAPSTEAKVAIGSAMQAEIDNYKDRRAKFVHAVYETARSQIAAGLSVVLIMVLMLSGVANAALTVTSSVIDDWAAVAEGAVDQSTVIDISSNYATVVHIQAFLDAAVAHEGTEFKIQVSGNSSGNEDWTDYAVFSELVGTPDAQTLNGDLAGGETAILLADTGGGYEAVQLGDWIAIEDSASAAANELVWRVGFTTDTSITALDATTNAHLSASNCYDIAMTRTLTIGMGHGSRARVICNNGYDNDGTASTLVWKVGKTVTTEL